MRFIVKVAPHPFPNRNHFRIVGDSSHPYCFAHRPPRFASAAFDKTSKYTPCLAKSARQGWGHPSLRILSEERYSQQRLADELAQNVARWCHHSARMRITEQAFDV